MQQTSNPSKGQKVKGHRQNRFAFSSFIHYFIGRPGFLIRSTSCKYNNQYEYELDFNSLNF